LTDSVRDRSATLSPVPEPRERPFWGLVDAFAGWVFAFIASSFVAAAVLSTGTWDLTTPPGTGGHVGALAAREAADLPLTSRMPLTIQTLLTVPLWIGLIGVPLLVSRWKGLGPVADFGLRTKFTDVPLGILIGVVSQLGGVWLIYQVLSPWIDPDEVDDAARELTDMVGGGMSLVVLVLLVGVGAPIAEEIFFRGLLYRALDRRLGRIVAVLGSAVLFGLTHFQLIQLPALVAFGVVLALLVHFTDRLGPAIWAHVGFNLTTLVVLLGFA